MKLKVGDKIMFDKNPDVIREIVEVRTTGYTWRYPGSEPVDLSNTWISENSNDPFFDGLWEKVENKARNGK